MRRYRIEPTKDDREYWEKVRTVGCVPCLMNITLNMPTTRMKVEIQHVTDGGRILGHRVVYGSCEFHHQGKFLPGSYTSYKDASSVYGPSFEREKGRFISVYGPEKQLVELSAVMVGEL